MNKVLKGLVAVAAAAAMAAAGAAGTSTAMAVQTAGTANLTINGVEKGDTFKVYRLLNSTGRLPATTRQSLTTCVPIPVTLLRRIRLVLSPLLLQ